MSRKKHLNYDDILTPEQLAELSHAVARKYAKYHNLPKGYTTPQRDPNPPECSTDGCGNPRVPMDHQWFTGKPRFRNICDACHQRNTAGKHGLKNILQVVAKNAGYNSVGEYLDAQAIAEGFKSHTERMNAKHPYRQHRKDYCENTDSRLGYTCTTTIVWEGMLDVDHIDGNPFNNSESNLQTLCKCCHAYKTNIEGDYKTPGRKTKLLDSDTV